MTLWKSNYLQKSSPPNTIPLDTGLQHMDFGGHKHSGQRKVEQRRSQWRENQNLLEEKPQI